MDFSALISPTRLPKRSSIRLIKPPNSCPSCTPRTVPASLARCSSTPGCSMTFDRRSTLDGCEFGAKNSAMTQSMDVHRLSAVDRSCYERPRKPSRQFHFAAPKSARFDPTTWFLSQIDHFPSSSITCRSDTSRNGTRRIYTTERRRGRVRSGGIAVAFGAVLPILVLLLVALTAPHPPLAWALDSDCRYMFTPENTGTGYGQFSTPEYPNLYPANKNCLFQFRAGAGHVVWIWWDSFHLEEPFLKNNQCLHDYVEILITDYQGQQHVSSRFCGQRQPPNLETMQPDVDIRFHSSHTSHYQGFAGKFKFLHEREVGAPQSSIAPSVPAPLAQQCGGTAAGVHSGVITSPGFPQMYPGEIECNWLIRVNEDKKVFVKMMDLYLTQGLECNRAAVYIQDGYRHQDLLTASTDANNLRYSPSEARVRFCGDISYHIQEGQKSYISDRNRMLVKFVARIPPPDALIDAYERQEKPVGFRLVWTAVEETDVTYGGQESTASCSGFLCTGGEFCIDEGKRVCAKRKRYCIDKSLVCDGLPNCAEHDDSDEENCYALQITATGVLAVAFLVCVIVTVICCQRRRNRRTLDRMKRDRTYGQAQQPPPSNTQSQPLADRSRSPDPLAPGGQRGVPLGQTVLSPGWQPPLQGSGAVNRESSPRGGAEHKQGRGRMLEGPAAFSRARSMSPSSSASGGGHRGPLMNRHYPPPSGVPNHPPGGSSACASSLELTALPHNYHNAPAEYYSEEDDARHPFLPPNGGVPGAGGANHVGAGRPWHHHHGASVTPPPRYTPCSASAYQHSSNTLSTTTASSSRRRPTSAAGGNYGSQQQHNAAARPPLKVTAVPPPQVSAAQSDACRCGPAAGAPADSRQSSVDTMSPPLVRVHHRSHPTATLLAETTIDSDLRLVAGAGGAQPQSRSRSAGAPLHRGRPPPPPAASAVLTAQAVPAYAVGASTTSGESSDSMAAMTSSTGAGGTKKKSVGFTDHHVVIVPSPYGTVERGGPPQTQGQQLEVLEEESMSGTGTTPTLSTGNTLGRQPGSGHNERMNDADQPPPPPAWMLRDGSVQQEATSTSGGRHKPAIV